MVHAATESNTREQRGDSSPPFSVGTQLAEQRHGQFYVFERRHGSEDGQRPSDREVFACIFLAPSHFSVCGHQTVRYLQL